MREALIVGAVRTPVGRRGGAYAGVHAVELGAAVLRALVERAGVDPGRVDDVIMGCVSQVGEQSVNVARNAWLAAGLPEDVPGVTIDRQCGSSQQAAHFAAQGVIAGAYDLVVAGGVEHMTRVPMGSSMQGPGDALAPLRGRYGDRLVPQGISAELIADKWGLDREELDAFALRSHRRAAAAQDAGRLDGHLVQVPASRQGPELQGGVRPALARDEGVRRDTGPDRLVALAPAFRAGGRITAGNSSQISDGASALLIAERATAAALGLEPLARFAGFALAGVDPVLMLTGPIPATAKLLARSGLRLDDIDVVEVNEAFASVVLAWGRELHPDWERVNPNGGAIAIGHPLGASGTRIMADLVHELRRRGGRYGLQVVCEGGGLANATLLERVGGGA
ncbi:MAG TPA: thiolase family protein [Actinomycetes bacterium]|nr:thiolase family protein [Actinomycetes bacterium]